jgi:hypothetical protein
VTAALAKADAERILGLRTELVGAQELIRQRGFPKVQELIDLAGTANKTGPCCLFPAMFDFQVAS